MLIKKRTNRTFRIRKKWYSCSSVFDCFLPPKEILEAKLHQAIESAKTKYFIDNKEKK